MNRTRLRGRTPLRILIRCSRPSGSDHRIVELTTPRVAYCRFLPEKHVVQDSVRVRNEIGLKRRKLMYYDPVEIILNTSYELLLFRI